MQCAYELYTRESLSEECAFVVGPVVVIHSVSECEFRTSSDRNPTEKSTEVVGTKVVAVVFIVLFPQEFVDV